MSHDGEPSWEASARPEQVDGDIETARQRSRALTVLLEASERLTSTLELQTVLQATVDGVAKLADLSTAAVYLREDDQDDQVVLWATTPPLPADFPDTMRRFPLKDHPRLHRALMGGEPLLVHDIRAEPLTETERAVVQQRNLCTLLYLPLMADGGAVGALIVGSTDQPVRLDEVEIDLCNALANLATLAVRNAELFAARRRHAAQLEQALEERKKSEAERTALQRRLAQSQKLETVGRLAGGVAHDFNNMLSAILMNVESALSQVEPGGRMHADLTVIQQAAERSALLTSQLLALARVQPAVPRKVQLNETVTTVLGMVRRVLGEEIEVGWSPHEDLWSVMIDPGQVDQVLVNLCVNARDALSQDGRITIETANVSKADALADPAIREQPDFQPIDYVALTVGDNGVGMDERTQAQIFEPFFTTKALGHGTGLGLATAYGIVKQNGGLIAVHSVLGTGSSFRILLPRCHTTELDATPPSGPPTTSPRGHELILLVEDEPMLLSLSQGILERQGYRVLPAATPQQALPLAEKHGEEICLLLSDVRLPGMSGPKLASKLRARIPNLKVLYVSGYAPEGALGEGALHGAHFLAKPYNSEALVSKVREVLDH